ncbi:MAG: hypothetical protein QNJ90_05670 [Planctomycetota bacterium]|nr:hypothetical protein [Planctomycetota bacterium]
MRRPFLHAATGLLALTLGLLPAPLHLVGAGLGLVAGWIVFPLTAFGRSLQRPGEPFFAGLRTYPVAVFALVLLLPRAEAAAAWGVLAFGDVAAALVGRALPAPAIFGHPKATWSGSGAYLLAGGLAAWGLSSGAAALASGTGWVVIDAAPTVLACFAAAGAATLADLVPLPPDDNLPAAAAAGAVLYLLGNPT